MREKGGLHMEKMEHMDPQRCDRILSLIHI